MCDHCRPKKALVVEGGNDQWRKCCCGGGCCNNTELLSSGYGIQRTALQKQPPMIDQSQLAQQQNSVYCTNDIAGPVGYGMGRNGYNSNTNYATTERNMSCGSGAPSMRSGVCPAIERNLPCTPIREPKCTGGDCRDEDSDSEPST